MLDTRYGDTSIKAKLWPIELTESRPARNSPRVGARNYSMFLSKQSVMAVYLLDLQGTMDQARSSAIARCQLAEELSKSEPLDLVDELWTR